MSNAAAEKQITGYCEPWSLRAGEPVSLHAAAAEAADATIDIVKLVCGDPGAKGPGFQEHAVASIPALAAALVPQELTPGSWGRIDLDATQIRERLRLLLHCMPTRPQGLQVLVTLGGDGSRALTLQLLDGQLQLVVDGQTVPLRGAPLAASRWYAVTIELDLVAGNVSGSLAAVRTRSPGRDIGENTPVRFHHDLGGAVRIAPLDTLLLARDPQGHFFDGRLARLALTLDETDLRWDFAREPHARCLPERHGLRADGELFELPARAVTGPDWDGTAHCWQHCPQHYDAIHFHSDDLYDAGWPATWSLRLPADLGSGIYAFRIKTRTDTDRIPFFVRPAAGAATADIALLMPGFTYMAYANHRMLLEGADFVAARNSLTREHRYVKDHPQVGLSTYEKHADGSGVMYSSRRRPVLQLRPGADRWNFTPDTCLNAFLTHLGLGHDVLADEDVHTDGAAALAPYRVLVTGTHPEYWSTAMLDALEQWQRDGGRLLYLGGNGFYWRVALSDEWPGAIELRRAEDGVRNWQTGPGENYHAFSGEYGGMWRRLGRAPNELVGIGYTAQGFERAAPYRRQPAADNPRAAWIFDGISDELIGTSGLGGGAAGQEIDRFEPLLGSPAHALVVATATAFGPDMIRTKEEFEAAVFIEPDDPLVRADMVFFETPAGGAVFSVGSIAWFGALARNDYDNDVARITANVLRRFVDAEPFAPPDQSTR